MKKTIKIILNRRFEILVILLYFCTISFLILQLQNIDIKDHNLLLSEYLKAGFFPFPPGYYFLVYIVDFVVRIKYPFVASSAIVLTFFLWWKYSLTHAWIKKEWEISPKACITFLITLSLLFISPIYIPFIDGDFWYLGKFTPTIWHNSTLICVFPFCILLTFQTLKWIEKGAISDLLYMTALGVVILLIKPSFLFCYIPALPIYLLLKNKKISGKVLTAIYLAIFFVLLIFIEKYIIFSWDPMIDKLYTTTEKPGIVLKPFNVWLQYSQEPIFDFLSSFPLLIAFLVIWRKKAFNSKFFTFTLYLLFFSLIVYMLFGETGFREFHGNFYWQIPIALFLNYLSIVLFIIHELFANKLKLSTRHYVLFTIYGVQVLMGLGYWIRIFLERTLS